jgi:hypothetical protein
MADPVFDPDLPRNNSPISASELRSQFNGLNETLGEAIAEAANGCAVNPWEVGQLGLTVSNPPTQAEVQAIADKLDELIGALTRA